MSFANPTLTASAAFLNNFIVAAVPGSVMKTFLPFKLQSLMKDIKSFQLTHPISRGMSGSTTSTFQCCSLRNSGIIIAPFRE